MKCQVTLDQALVNLSEMPLLSQVEGRKQLDQVQLVHFITCLELVVIMFGTSLALCVWHRSRP